MKSLIEKLTSKSIPGILCGIVILVLTGLPGSVFPRVKPVVGMDKVAHVVMYALFAFLCIWGYRKPFVSNGKGYRKKALWLTAIISVAYGGLTEMMQEYIVRHGRYGDWFDFLADAIGTLVGLLVFHFFFGQKK